MERKPANRIGELKGKMDWTNIYYYYDCIEWKMKLNKEINAKKIILLK